MTLKEELKNQILLQDNGEYWLDFYEMNVDKWPQVSLLDENGVVEDIEPLDLENTYIIGLTDDKLTLQCGGDWQDPLELDIELINNKLTVTDVRNITHVSSNDISEEDFINNYLL